MSAGSPRRARRSRPIAKDSVPPAAAGASLARARAAPQPQPQEPARRTIHQRRFASCRYHHLEISSGPPWNDRYCMLARTRNAEKKMSSGGTWIDQFPGNFMWSNATLVCKGMAPYGAVAVGEIGRICERLAGRGMGDPDACWQEWCWMAEKNEKLADAGAVDGRDFTAGDHYLRAGDYSHTGERFVPPGEKKLGIYRKALRCYQEGLKRRHRNIEFVEVPYEGKTLPAYFMKADADHDNAGRAPTVVLFDGMDNCKEMSVLFAGL